MNRRLIWLLITGFLLAVISFFFLQRIQSSPERVPDTTASTNISGSNLNEAYRPANFQTISQVGKEIRIAGTAEPGATVFVLNLSDILRQVQVTDDGKWAANIQVIENEIMEISLQLKLDSERIIQSDEILFRVPFPVPLGDNAPENITRTLVPALVLLTSPGGASRILQSPFSPSGPLEPLRLGPIDYDDLGAVIFSGRASLQGRVRIYVNGNAIGDTRVAPDGRWFYIRADTLAVGTYDISVELTPPTGESIRISKAFERLSPDVSQSADETFVKFEPLRWQLRRGLKRGGAQYTTIFAPDEVSQLPVPQIKN